MGDRGGDEDVEVEGVEVRVASLRMGKQVGGGRWRWLGADGWLETQPGSQPRRRHPRCGPRALRGGGGGSSGGVPGCGGGDAPGGARLRVRARGGLGTRPGEGAGADRAGGFGGGAGGREPGRSCGHRGPGSPATALARTARAVAPGAGTRLLPQPPPRRTRHRPVSQEPSGRLPAPPASRSPLAPRGAAPPGEGSPAPAGKTESALAAQPAQAWGSWLRGQRPHQEADGGLVGAGCQVFPWGWRMTAHHLGTPLLPTVARSPMLPGYSKPPSVTPHPLPNPLQSPSLSPG